MERTGRGWTGIPRRKACWSDGESLVFAVKNEPIVLGRFLFWVFVHCLGVFVRCFLLLTRASSLVSPRTRHEDCDIRVQLPTVSRRHATLSVDKKTMLVTILDHSSVNVTTVNNIAIAGKTVVNHGDKITFGDRSFRFEYAEGKVRAVNAFVKGRFPRRKCGGGVCFFSVSFSSLFIFGPCN